jgi:hypothetical protein
MTQTLCGAYQNNLIDNHRIYVDAKSLSISKTFVLFDRNSTFTGLRDPRNFNYLLLNEISTYRNGTTEYRSYSLNEDQVNKLFTKLDNDNFSCCMHPPPAKWN